MDTDIDVFDVNIWVSALLAFEKTWMTDRLRGAKNYAFSKENFALYCTQSSDMRISDLGTSIQLNKIPSSYRIQETLKRVLSKVFKMSPERLSNVLDLQKNSCIPNLYMDTALDSHDAVYNASRGTMRDFEQTAPENTAKLDHYSYRKVHEQDKGIDMEDMVLTQMIKNFLTKHPQFKASFVTADKALAIGLQKIVDASRFPKTQVVMYSKKQNEWNCLVGTKILDLEKPAKVYIRKPFKPRSEPVVAQERRP